VQAGIKTIVIPEQNRKDLEDIPRHLRQKVRFVYAGRIDQVLEAALKEKP
ncbi:MAG: hypothetical protein C0615_02555, partial [Desulfuromonas sp.]